MPHKTIVASAQQIQVLELTLALLQAMSVVVLVKCLMNVWFAMAMLTLLIV